MSPVGGVLEIGGTRARESVMPLKLAIAREIWPGTLRSGKGLSGLVCVAGDITCLAWRGGGLCQGECSWLLRDMCEILDVLYFRTHAVAFARAPGIDGRACLREARLAWGFSLGCRRPRPTCASLLVHDYVGAWLRRFA